MTLRDRLSDARESIGERLGGGSGGDSMVQEARKRGRRRKLKRRAKEAVPSVPSEMSNREVAAKVRSGATRLAAAAEHPESSRPSSDDQGIGFGESSEDVARRAERAATVADPIGTTLDPAEPMGVDDMARGRAGGGESEEEQPPDGADAAAPIPNPLWGSGDGDADDLLSFGGNGAGGEGDDNPLEFEDAFGLGGSGDGGGER